MFEGLIFVDVGRDSKTESHGLSGMMLINRQSSTIAEFLTNERDNWETGKFY